MLSRILGGMIIGVALLGITVAAEQTTTVKGTVFTTKTSAGTKIVTLMAPGATYTVVMDDRGEKLSKDMTGKKVEVVGVVTREGDTSLVRVLSYSPILTGRVEAVKDPGGNITLVHLIATDGTTYNVKLDNKGIELGKTMDGKMTDVVSTIDKKKTLFIGKNEITVKSFEAHKESG